MMQFTIDTLHQKLCHFTSESDFVIAYSGGLDSHVLLHGLATLAKRNSTIKLRAIHVNHGLSPHANSWAKHCQNTCQNLGVECEIIAVNAIDAHKSPEEAARDARYAALANALKNTEILLTAHHCDDQVETVFLRLMRGAGPKGLAAMASKMSFAQSYLIRPLLEFTRDQLQAYAVQHQLQWIEDESNSDRRFDRNYMRHEIMPILQHRWPAILQTVHRSAQHCAETASLLDQLAAQDLQLVKGSDENTLLISALLQLPDERQRNVLRYWLESLRLPVPTTVKLKQLQCDVLHSRYDAMPKITWPGAEVRRYRHQLYAMSPLPPQDVNVKLAWNLQDDLLLPNNLGVLRARQELGQGLRVENPHSVTVRYRKGGEILHPTGRQGSHPLKKLFQEWNIPPWQRDRIPLIFVEDILVVVVGYAMDCKFAVKGEERGLNIILINSLYNL